MSDQQNPFLQDQMHNSAPVMEPTQPQQTTQLKSPQQKAPESKSTITIKNTEPKGSPKYGILESLRQKWTAHIETNKEKARKAKEKKEKEDAVMEELFQNFDPKKDKKKLTPAIRKRIIEAEKIYNDGIVTIKDLIAPSSFEVSPQTVKLNGKYAKTFFVYNYPRFLEANWLNPIVNYDVSMDMSLFIYPTDSGKMLRILKKKGSRNDVDKKHQRKTRSNQRYIA